MPLKLLGNAYMLYIQQGTSDMQSAVVVQMYKSGWIGVSPVSLSGQRSRQADEL